MTLLYLALLCGLGSMMCLLVIGLEFSLSAKIPLHILILIIRHFFMNFLKKFRNSLGNFMGIFLAFFSGSGTVFYFL